MGDAVDVGILVAGAGLDPDADRNRADVLHLFSENGETIRQHFAFNVPDLLRPSLLSIVHSNVCLRGGPKTLKMK